MYIELCIFMQILMQNIHYNMYRLHETLKDLKIFKCISKIKRPYDNYTERIINDSILFSWSISVKKY